MNIPIYRAKKIDGDEWVEGWLRHNPTYDERSKYQIEPCNTSRLHGVDPNTLAIHFPNMIKDMFASFDYISGVGGAKFSFKYHTENADMFNLVGVLVWNDLGHRLEVLVLENSYGFEVLYYDDLIMTNIEVIGIHKG